MAIRKVLGAATGGVLALLLKPFTVYILVANALALPVVWLAMDRWLDSFAYRIEPGLSLFLVAVFATLVIGLMSVFWRSVSTARVNPAVTLAGD